MIIEGGCLWLVHHKGIVSAEDTVHPVGENEVATDKEKNASEGFVQRSARTPVEAEGKEEGSGNDEDV